MCVNGLRVGEANSKFKCTSNVSKNRFSALHSNDVGISQNLDILPKANAISGRVQVITYIRLRISSL